MRMLAVLCGVVCALLPGPATASADDLSATDRAAIAALEQRVSPLPGPGAATGTPAPLAQRMAETHVPAVSVAFIEDGRIRWTRAYGETVAGSGRSVTPHTLFQAASMSKAVAAAGALRLVDQGRLALDEDVSRRLRGWSVPVAADAGDAVVTLRRLLSHTAGLSVAGYPGYASGAAVPNDIESLSGQRANTAAVRAFAVPGAGLAYSGGGYTVAQLLMREAAGAGFDPLMRAAVFGPAGMAESSFAQPLTGPALARAAGGHGADGAPVPGGAHTYPELAAAGLWTTPSDYARFLIALQESWAGRPAALLTPRSARAMATPVLGQYGLGVIVVARGERTAITHGGSNEGFQSRFAAYLDGTRQGLVVMTNGDNGGALAAAIHHTLAQAYGWDNLSTPPFPRAPDE